MKSMLRPAFALLALAVLGACAPVHKSGIDGAAEATRGATPALAGRQWQLVDFTGQDLTLLAQTQPVTLRFEESTLGGQAPCNVISAAYTLDGETMKIGPVTASKKACLAVINLEANYFEALATVDRVEIVNGFLRLHGRDVVLTYQEIVDR
jgi:heat shock protein HslJ